MFQMKEKKKMKLRMKENLKVICLKMKKHLLKKMLQSGIFASLRLNS